MDEIISILTSGLQQGLIWSLLVLGVYISYRILDCADLGVEGVFPLGASIAGLLIFSGVNPVLATIIAMVGGIVGGIITALIHTKLKIPMILAGIITMTGMLSINLVLLGFASETTNSLATLSIDKTVYKGPTDVVYKFFKETCGIEGFKRATASKITVVTLTTAIMLVCYGAIYYLFGTEIGMSLRATGNNERMAQAQGINTTTMIIIGLAISNGLVALSGALFAQNAGTANVESGRGTIVIGLAAIIIGEIIFGKRTFKVALVSCVVGSILFFILKATAIKLGVDHYLNLVVAILITVILALPVIKPTLMKKHSKKVDAC